MLDWLGDEGDLMHKAFVRVFGDKVRPYGKRSTHIGGLSDGHEGVQWNVGYDPRDHRKWIGVNLEGMQYDNWPVARLIERERRNPRLPKLAKEIGDTGAADVLWTRDYWQASSRPEIIEGNIPPTPIVLSRLSEDLWQEALSGAYECLASVGGRYSRARQTVTLAGSGKQREGGVSPHLTLRLPDTLNLDWTTFLDSAKRQMQPFYDWAVRAAA